MGEVMKKYINGKYIEMPPEELAAMQDAQAQSEAAERHRPMTESEVLTMLLKQQVNAMEVDDQTAYRMRQYYPTFAELVGQTVKQGTKFRADDGEDADLYKTIQPDLTIQEHYPPGEGTESLYAHIDEVHDGTLYDPIPYDGNMALTAGLYYSQDRVTYLCSRDTVNPVYNPLRELVGLYVEIAE